MSGVTNVDIFLILVGFFSLVKVKTSSGLNWPSCEDAVIEVCRVHGHLEVKSVISRR